MAGECCSLVLPPEEPPNNDSAVRRIVRDSTKWGLVSPVSIDRFFFRDLYRILSGKVCATARAPGGLHLGAILTVLDDDSDPVRNRVNEIESG
jgi:hypothetical protein